MDLVGRTGSKLHYKADMICFMRQKGSKHDQTTVYLKMRARTLNVNKMQRKATEGVKRSIFTSEQKY